MAITVTKTVTVGSHDKESKDIEIKGDIVEGALTSFFISRYAYDNFDTTYFTGKQIHILIDRLNEFVEETNKHMESKNKGIEHE